MLWCPLLKVTLHHRLLQFIHPYMDRPLSKKIRTALEKMTYFYGQPIRKKAAILATKPHTRLHLNHVVMTPVAQDHCGAPHVWNALPSQNPRQARGEERKMNGFSLC
jgi:hypothetical protein